MRRTATLIAAPVAVSVAVFVDGGYGSFARLVFAATALTAAALLLGPPACRGPRQPVVLVLLALAALGAVSALWTLGPADRTIEWSLVTAGYAAVAALAAAAWRAHPRTGELLAGSLLVIAMASAAAGLVAATTFLTPYAERVAGVWRPGGPFEYAPALALLQVSALPALLAWTAHRSRVRAGVGAVGIALAGGVLALAASRLELALALIVGGLALAYPRATVRAPRSVTAGALALAAVAGFVLHLVAGAPVGPRADAPPERWATVLAVALLAAPAWLALRRAITATTRDATLLPRASSPRAAAAVVALGLLAGATAFGTSPHRGAGPPSDFLHGRTDTWGAAVATFTDRPLTGVGADAFLAGSARHQDGQTIVFAHDLPLELAAELGVLGLLLGLALYLTTCAALVRARRTEAAWLFGPAAAAFLLASLVDWPWHLAGAGAVWAMSMGALAGAAGVAVARPNTGAAGAATK